jgi:hypothetical protein
MLHNPKIEIEHEAKQILNFAADYIEKHGWCQRAMSMPDGRVCLFGSIRAFGFMPDEVHVELGHRLKKITKGYRNPATWNDALGRTKEEVIKALRKAAR